MINGSHIVVYSTDAEADRAFFREVLGFHHVDAGEGWLIFALPPSEVAFHPAGENDNHELFLMCEDLQATMSSLQGRGVRFSVPSERSWGILTEMRLPGGGRIGLYQPKHPLANPSSA